MHYQTLHSWDLTAEEAKEQQTLLCGLVSLADGFGEINTIAGVDLSLDTENNRGHAIVVVLSYPNFQVLETRYATAPLKMPYIPGLLSFRESPVALEAFAQVETVPDLILVDGQGQAHPRRFGIACHLGVLLDIPSIGVAKSRLYGRYSEAALGDAPGAEVPLTDQRGQNTIGAVVRTKKHTNPLFISPGHKVSVESATRVVLDCIRGYRLPEPTRQAHNFITAYKKADGAGLVTETSPQVRLLL